MDAERDTEEQPKPIKVQLSAKEVRDGFNNTSERCHCCLFGLGQPADEDSNPLHARVQTFLVRNIMNMEPEILSEEVAAFYEENVRKRVRHDHRDMPRWTSRMVHTHLTSHTLDPQLMMVFQLRSVNMAAVQYENIMYYKHEDGTKSIDNDATKLMLACQKRATDLFRELRKQD